jgi:predicted ATPase
MLQELKIENFRSLKSVTVPLRPLTVLVGPNNSGKSAFLAALQCLVGGHNYEPWDFWQHDNQVKMSVSGKTKLGTSYYTSSGERIHDQFLSVLRPMQLFHLQSQGIAMESSGTYDDRGTSPEMNANGEGVSSLFDYLLRRDRERFFAAIDALRSLVPGLIDLEIATPQPGTRRLDLIIENNLRIPGNMTSAGVRLLLVFVALAYHPNPPKLILLEEPETGVHPKRMGELVRMLREMTEGKHCGHSAQVVLTTHSPYLLDLVDLEKEQVLVFSRLKDGSCTAEPADAERLKIFLDEFMLGEVWFNQGEEGLVAKRS